MFQRPSYPLFRPGSQSLEHVAHRFGPDRVDETLHMSEMPQTGSLFSPSHWAWLDQRFPRISHATGGEKMFGDMLQAFEVVGVAGTMSYLNAKHAAAGRNAYEIAGIPVDIVLGLLFSGLSVAGYFGEHGKHSFNVGSGFLAAYACRQASIWGGAARQQSGAHKELPPPAPFQAAGSIAESSSPRKYDWAA
jgi:hypothetical protein